MSIHDYIQKMREIQSKLIKFIEAEDKIEENFQNLTNFFDDQIHEDRQKVCTILHLISRIANNHHRNENFFKKIEKVLQIFRKDIENYFTNSEIFDIFKGSKKILLFLFQSNVIKMDEYISRIMLSRKYKIFSYPEYFYPEIKPFLTELTLFTISEKIPEDFDQKRLNGENESLICELIRKDEIEEFIIYVNRMNFPLKSQVEESIFETNPFLLKNKKTSLIEYAAFFGSIQIFKYLFLNGAEPSDLIWLYAMHGLNEELIHFLEENKIDAYFEIIEIEKYGGYEEIVSKKIKSFEGCLKESIKCHHNDITNYIKDNYYENSENENFRNDENKYDLNILSYCFHFYNFEFFPLDFDQKNIFYYLCHYGYYTLVDILLKAKEIELNNTIIQSKKKFYKIFN